MPLYFQIDIDQLRAAGDMAAIASNNEALAPRRGPYGNNDDAVTRVLQPPSQGSRPPSTSECVHIRVHVCECAYWCV